MSHPENHLTTRDAQHRHFCIMHFAFCISDKP